MEEKMKKDLKRWLKRRVKITLGFVVSFMITGTVGYAEESNGLWNEQWNGNKVVEPGNLNIKTNGVGIGYNGTVDIKKGDLIINAGGNGIQSGYMKNAKINIFANNITINSGANGIFSSWGDWSNFIQGHKGSVALGEEKGRKIKNLTILSEGQGIDNKKGEVKIYGENDSIVNITSQGTGGKKGNPQHGISNTDSDGKITLIGGQINIIANGENRKDGETSGIGNEGSKGIIKINSNGLKVISKNGNGIKNSGSSGKVDIDLKDNLKVQAKKEGVLAKSGEVLIKANNIFIGKIDENGNPVYNKNGILEKGGTIGLSAVGENSVININQQAEGNGNIDISVTNKALNADKGKININSAKNNINLNSNSKTDVTFGINTKNNGTVNLKGKDINILSNSARSSYGIKSSSLGNVNIESIDGNITTNVSSESETEGAYSIHNEEEGKILMLGNNIILNTSSNLKDGATVETSSIWSDNGKINLNSKNNIIVNSKGNGGTTSGIRISNGKAELKAKKDIIVHSEGKEDIRAIEVVDPTGEIILETENNIKIDSISSGKEINYNYSGIANIGKLFLKGNNIEINTLTDGRASYGILAAMGTTTMDTKNTQSKQKGNIIVNSKSINNMAMGLYFDGSQGNIINSGNNIEVNNEGTLGYGILVGNSSLNMSADKNIKIGTLVDTLGIGLYNVANSNVKLDSKGVINILSESKKGESKGIDNNGSKLNLTSKGNIDISSKGNEKTYGILSQSNSNLNISGKEKVNINATGLKETYGVLLTNHSAVNSGENVSNIEGKNIDINVNSIKKEAYGILARDSKLILNGNTNIILKGREINPEKANEMTKEQEEFARESLKYGNNTISKIFSSYDEQDKKVYSGTVNQGLRSSNSNIILNGNLSIDSTDIAMTSIGEKSDVTVNGKSNFIGNKYVLNIGKETSRLIAKPVVQALDGGKITLNGATYVESVKDENAEPHISNVGLYAQGHTDIKTGTEKSIININGDLAVNPNKEKCDISVMATSGGYVYINQNPKKEKGNVSLCGDIVSGKHDSEIKISGKDVNIVGDVLAANGGKIGIDLKTENSNLVGRVDDYFDIGRGLGTDTLRNDKYKRDIESFGTVTINMDNQSNWIVDGQSYVSNLNFGSNGGNIYMDRGAKINREALYIDNISGNGTFYIGLNDQEKEKGTMLYILNGEKGKHTVNVKYDDIKNLKAGEELRFATLGENAKNNDVNFVVNDIQEQGIKDVSFFTKYRDYDLKDKENEIYNGKETTDNKPGDKIIDEKYEKGENWYLIREEEKINVNDIGQNIIEMAKSNYATAVYMDNLNKRLGDMTFVDGDEGYWVRLRNDRVGEDEEYRLHNNMYQIGYDKSYPMEEGKGTEFRGLAFEYTKGDMEYKNIIGNSDVDRVALWAYDTNLYNDGFYSDYVFRAGRISSEFDITGRKTGNKVTGDYHNLFAGASAEFGKRYDITEKTYFEPQVQLQYTYIDDVDYTTNQNTKVDYSEIHSLIGRAGFRLGHDFYKENSKDNTIYLKADINHEFLGEQDIKAYDLTGSINETHNNDTWYDIGIGTAKNLTENLYVYADAERQFGHKDNSWQFNLGFRYKFNSIKDFSLVNLFDFDKSEIKPDAKKVIEEVSRELNKKKYKGTLKLEGHTDWTGSREYNQKLSERRAKAVENELRKNITNEKLKYDVQGFGEDRPVADNKTKAGRAENRRVEGKYIK